MTPRGAIGPDTIVARNDEPIAVEVDRSVVMMSLAQGMYFGLEGVGMRIWALLEKPSSGRQLAAELLGEFEIDSETCLRETCEFLEELQDAQLIRVINETAGSTRPSASS